MRFLGYSVTNAKLFVFTVSAVLAGIAGALYVPQIGIINPSEFSPGNSIEIAIWVSVGGRGTLIGAILGAVLVNSAKTWLTSAAPETWLFVLGALFILTTLIFPRGLDRFVTISKARSNLLASSGPRWRTGMRSQGVGERPPFFISTASRCKL